MTSAICGEIAMAMEMGWRSRRRREVLRTAIKWLSERQATTWSRADPSQQYQNTYRPPAPSSARLFVVVALLVNQFWMEDFCCAKGAFA
jgi:hypothetical protein